MNEVVDQAYDKNGSISIKLLIYKCLPLRVSTNISACHSLVAFTKVRKQPFLLIISSRMTTFYEPEKRKATSLS